MQIVYAILSAERKASYEKTKNVALYFLRALSVDVRVLSRYGRDHAGAAGGSDFGLVRGKS